MDYLHIAIAEILLKLLRDDPKKALITYSVLADQIDNLVTPLNTSTYLGDLSTWAYENGAPMISAMVINQKQLQPGNGFFILYHDLTGKNIGDKEAVFRSELKKVKEYGQWDKFALSLGITDIF